MPTSPRASAHRAQAAQWPGPVQAIHWRWRCPATAWCAAMATCPATPGASRASANCCAGKRPRLPDVGADPGRPAL
ncbi:hypothetical protein G6F32_016758 [Rhizopus arrhizus]|nr:hypothetical protein G6F32_016758 [Rhizopus arrhizus]